MDQTPPKTQPTTPPPPQASPAVPPPVPPVAAGAQPAAPVKAAAPVAPAPDMADTVMDTVTKYSPFKAAWWVALLQGLVAAGLGIMLLLYPAEAANAIGPFLALYLLIHGLFEVSAGSNKPRTVTAETIAFYRGIVGAAIGGVLISLFFLNLLSRETGLLWLSIGLLIYGAGGLYLAFARARGNGRILSLVGAVLFVVLGGIGLWGRVRPEGTGAPIIAWTLVVMGIALVVVAFIRRSSANAAAEEAAAAKAPTKKG